MWIILSTLAALAFFLSGTNKNVIGGAATLGAIGGTIAEVIYHQSGSEFRLSTIGKWIVVFILVGCAIEILSLLISKYRK